MNNLAKLLPLKHILKYILVLLITLTSPLIIAQELDYANSKKYTIAEIAVNGNTTFSEQTIITYSGLRKGSEVKIPGEEISDAITKLWKSNLFSDIEVYLLRTEGNSAYLEIRLSDLPELNEVVINGVRKGNKETIIKENNLKPGVKVTENLITTTRNYLQNKYKKDGYLGAKVKITTYYRFYK